MTFNEVTSGLKGHSELNFGEQFAFHRNLMAACICSLTGVVCTIEETYIETSQ